MDVVVDEARNHRGDRSQPPVRLTRRERQVLQLLATGKSNRQIADEMIVSIETVKVHLSHIFGKLEVTSRTQAAVRAIALGMIGTRA